MTSLSEELTELQFPDWQGEFEAATCENDRDKRPERLQALRIAIFTRLKEKPSRPPGTVERIALNDAIQLLRVLRSESSPYHDGNDSEPE
jgi:hypothetical protein